MNTAIDYVKHKLPTVQEFEHGQLTDENFDHVGHVFVTWKMLESASVLETLQRSSIALRRLTKRLGVEAKYNETITWFFVFLIAERRLRKATSTWEQFATENADLMANSKQLLAKFYSPEKLSNVLAQQQFLMPDR